MSKPFSITSSLFTFLLLQYTFFPTVESTECVEINSPKTRTFKNLVELQHNKIPFDVSNPKSGGNYVRLTEGDIIDTLYKNSFITLESEHIAALFLDNHQIHTIQDGAFSSLPCVMHLYLQKNLIDTISRGMFQDLKGLHQLDLGENYIKEIPERVFIANLRLRKLNISRNNLRVLHAESFYRLSLLEELDLSFNRLLRIQPATFQFFDKLVNLQLGTNQLERLDIEKFNNLSKLNVLNLSSNALESFDTGNKFSFGASLSQLYLSDNLLTQLNPFGISNNIPNLKVIDIDDNPWFCSDLLPILRKFNDTRISYTGATKDGPNIAGISCNKSFEEYKQKKWISNVEPTKLPSTTIETPTSNIQSVLEKKTEDMQQTLGNLYAITVGLFVMTILLFVFNIVVQCGGLQIITRCRNPSPVLDNDVETFSLLRQGF